MKLITQQEIETAKQKIYPVFKRLVIIHLTLLWLVPKNYREIFIQALEKQFNFIAEFELLFNDAGLARLPGKNIKESAKCLKNIFLSEFKGSVETILRCNILYEHTYDCNFTYPNMVTSTKLLYQSTFHSLNPGDNKDMLENVHRQRVEAILNLEGHDSFYERNKEYFFLFFFAILSLYIVLITFNGLGIVHNNESYLTRYLPRSLVLLALSYVLFFNEGASFRLSSAGRDLWMKAMPVHTGLPFSTNSAHPDIKAILNTTSISLQVETELLRMFTRVFAKLKLKPQENKKSSVLGALPALVEKKSEEKTPPVITETRIDNYYSHYKRLPKNSLSTLTKTTNDLSEKKASLIEWKRSPTNSADSIFLNDHSAELKPGRLVFKGRETPWFVLLNMNKLAKEIPEETLNKFRLLLLQYKIVHKGKGNGYWYVTPNSPVILGKEKITLNTPFGFVVKSFSNHQNQKNVRVLVTPIAEAKVRDKKTEKEQSMYLCSNTHVAFHG